MANENRIVLSGKINFQKIHDLLDKRISETIPQSLRRLINDGKVDIRTTVQGKQGFVEFYRGVVEDDKLGRCIVSTLSFCDEIRIVPEGIEIEPKSKGE